METHGLSDEDLVRAARVARDNAYAPYSHFAVGAAVLGSSGRVYTGANVENASYGLTMCAERVAVFGAASAGERSIVAVAVATGGSTPTPPCGACRQVIHELGATAHVVAEADGVCQVWEMAELLPAAFGPDSLQGTSSKPVDER